MPVSQACFLGQSISRQNSLIADAFNNLAFGEFLNLPCASSDALSRWYLYNAVSELSEQVALSSVAAGTAYTMTAAYASLDFGTTDPVITFDRTGTYQILASVQTGFVGATYAALESASFKLRRTNNTAADIGTFRSAVLPIMTTTTLAGGPSVTILQANYNATAGDVMTIQGILSALPSAGSVTVSAAKIIANPVVS